MSRLALAKSPFMLPKHEHMCIDTRAKPTVITLKFTCMHTIVAFVGTWSWATAARHLAACNKIPSNLVQVHDYLQPEQVLLQMERFQIESIRRRVELMMRPSQHVICRRDMCARQQHWQTRGNHGAGVQQKQGTHNQCPVLKSSKILQTR